MKFFALEREDGVHKLVIWEEKTPGLPERVLDSVISHSEDRLIQILERPYWTDVIQKKSFPRPA